VRSFANTQKESHTTWSGTTLTRSRGSSDLLITLSLFAVERNTLQRVRSILLCNTYDMCLHWSSPVNFLNNLSTCIKSSIVLIQLDDHSELTSMVCRRLASCLLHHPRTLERIRQFHPTSLKIFSLLLSALRFQHKIDPSGLQKNQVKRS
jgi:hypothetical protein